MFIIIDMDEDKKELHLRDAAHYLKLFTDIRDRIHHSEIHEELEETIRSLRDLRDTEYYFESGEKELDQLYDRYLPYLNEILEKYLNLETSWNAAELKKVRFKLIRMMRKMRETMKEIQRILPEDEISEASAMAKAKKKKEELEQRLRRKDFSESS